MTRKTATVSCRGRLAGPAWIVATLAVAFVVSRAAAADNVLVAYGSVARILPNATDPGIGTAWISEAFDDTAWTAGAYGTGYETAPPGAVHLLVTEVPSTTRSIYTRARFQVDDPTSFGRLWFGADYDDGYVAWINGIEVARSGSMPSGTPAWNTAAASHESSNGTSPNYGALIDITAAARGALHSGVNVLAVGVWNTSGTSSDLVIVPRLSWECRAPLIRGPYLQMGTASSVVVRWRTASPTSSRVRYGTVLAAPSASAESTAVTTEHEVAIGGLNPHTRYYYDVGSTTDWCEGDDAAHSFVTAPETGSSQPTRIWVIGDSGLANDGARAVRDAYASYTSGTPTDLWLMLGDNAYTDGTDAQYQAGVFDTYPDMLRSTVLWPTLGNHDGVSADSATQTGPYYDNFTLPRYGEAGGVPSTTEAYYSFDWGNVHFVCLESSETDRSPNGPMATWLRADLAATQQDWIVAFWHHPPYSKGSHDSDVELELVQMRQNVVPALEAGGADLVMAGHSHSYERSYLLDGHYGTSGTLLPSMKKDAGDGRIDGRGAYHKPSAGPSPHEGTVYMVNGTAAQASGGSLNHPAMFYSTSDLGSVVIDVRGRQMDVVSLDSNGAARDHFTLVKGPSTPPEASFSVSPAAGVSPLPVQFTDRSSNTPTVWEWDFEDDGIVDSRANAPAHVYTTPGLYRVRMVAHNGFGADAAVRDAAVCVLSPNGTGDVDLDGIPDGADRCPCVWNPVETDTDADGIPDACDLDDDGDGVLDDEDCAPFDPSAFAPPQEVGDTVRPGSDPAELLWQPDGVASSWSVYRGSVAAGASFSFDHTCFASHLLDARVIDPASPAPGAWWYYLVAGRNACGEGSSGSTSGGAPRPTFECP